MTATNQMSTVERVQTFPLEYLIRDGGYGPSKVRPTVRAATLIKVTTSDGAVGWGESAGPPRLVAPALEVAARSVVGTPTSLREPRWLDQLARGYHLSAAGIPVAALSGLDIAMTDAQCRELGVPISSMLGGAMRSKVLAYASTGYYHSGDDAGTLRRYLSAAVDEGFTAAKIKIGSGIADDVLRAGIARDALGGDGVLMVDYNANETLGTAMASLRALRDVNPYFAEEPLPPNDRDGWRVLREIGIPLAAGEALSTRFGFREPIARRDIDIAQPNLSTCGGFAEAKAVAAMATANNVRVLPHAWGTGVLLAASLQFIATLAGSPFGEINRHPVMLELDRGENPLRDGVLQTPISHTAGMVAIPTGSGLGVEIDETELRRWVIPTVGHDIRRPGAP